MDIKPEQLISWSKPIKVEITITDTGAAFHPDGTPDNMIDGREVARILRRFEARVVVDDLGPGFTLSALDSNGNHAATLTVTA